jgi:hypothetical protein
VNDRVSRADGLLKSGAAKIAGFHRVLLVLSSVGLGVMGSRVATDLADWGSWALVAAFALLLFVADVARNIEERGKTIAVTTKTPLGAARRDVTTSSESRVITVATLLAVVFAAASLLLAWPLAPLF